MVLEIKTLALSLSFSHSSLKIFVKEEPNAPSAANSLSILGIRLATRKLSRIAVAPKTLAKITSLNRPDNLLKKVPRENNKLDLRSDKESSLGKKRIDII